MGEHVDGLYGGDAVFGVERGEVAGLRGGVAADVDDAARGGGEDGLDDAGMHTGARRVGDDDVGAALGGDEPGCEDVLHVAREKGGVADAVDAGVLLGVVDGLGNVLDAHDAGGLARHEEGDGAGAGIEVVDGLVACQRGEAARHFVEFVGLVRVGLVETFGSHLEAQPLHLLVDEVRADVGVHGKVADGVVALEVVDVEQRGDLGEVLVDVFEQRHSLPLLLVRAPGKLHEQHQFAGVAGAEHHRAQQPLLPPQVVVREAVAVGIGADGVAQAVVDVGHEAAFVDVEYLVECPGDVEAHGVGVFHRLAALDDLAREPPLVAEAELQFVAVGARLGAAQYGRHGRQFHLADAAQGVLHLFLFVVQLAVVAQALPLAAAAHAEMGAERLVALGAVGVYGHGLGLGVTVLLAAQLQVADVARHDVGREDHEAVDARQSLALGGDVLDGDVLEQR